MPFDPGPFALTRRLGFPRRHGEKGPVARSARPLDGNKMLQQGGGGHNLFALPPGLSFSCNQGEGVGMFPGRSCTLKPCRPL